jgi:hypothetical protein
MRAKRIAFDCVAMKRTGAAEVYHKTKGMTFQKQVEFWNGATEALLREQQAAVARTKTARGAK